MVIANGYLLWFVLYSALKALVYREDREQPWYIPVKTMYIDTQWLTSSAVGSIPAHTKFFLLVSGPF